MIANILKVSALSLGISFLSFAQEQTAATEKATLKLTSGETLIGTVSAVKEGSVSLITEHGPIRVAVDKLTLDTKSKLGITNAMDTESLQSRVRELEDLVARLREENASLRKGGSSGGVGSSPATPDVAAKLSNDAGTSKPAAATGSYKLTSSGKRHNSRCRYFSSAGKECGPTEGVACKICGG